MKKSTIGMKPLNILLLLLVIGSSAFGQAGNFRSLGSGTWATPGTWERDADLNGSFEESPSTVAPTSTSGTIVIQNTHVVTVAAVLTTDQTTIQSGGTLTINAGVTLTTGAGAGDDIKVNSGGILNVNGTVQMVAPIAGAANRLRVDGTVNNNGSFLNASSTKLIFQAGSNYFHLFDGTAANTIPPAGWSATSTVNITGFSAGGATTPSGLAQTFGNFVWNSPSMDQFLDLAGAPSIVNGNFQIDDTGAGGFYWNQGGGGNANLSVGGNFVVNGGVSAFIGQTGSVGVLTISGDMLLAGGYFQLTEDVNATIAVQGDLDISGSAILEFSAISAIADINLVGNYTYSGGDINVSSSPTGVGNLNFVGTSSTQTFTSTLVPAGPLNYSVSALSVLSVPGTNFIGGGGTLTVNGILEVGSTNSSGAMQTGTLAGNIRVSGTRTYNAASTITYNGAAGQLIGNGHPTTAGVNTTINNASGVSLIVGVPVIITTNLTLTSGNLNIGNGALTLSGNLTAGSNNVTIGSGGSITISGTGTIGTFPFPSGAQTFTNFTLDNPNGVTFANNVTITGIVTLTDGSISFGGSTLALNGTFASSGSGDLSPSSISTLSIGGSGAFGTPRINSTNNTVGTFTFIRSGGGAASLSSTLIVATAFNLTNGNFTNTNGLQIANGATVTRNSNAQLLGNPSNDIGQSYNVTYTGSTLTTGLELPTTATDMLRNLVINGGPVTLNKNIIINGNVDLQNSTFDANGFNITLSSTSGTWNKGSGNFTGGTGTLTISGTANISITSSSTPSFSNVTANSGFNLTMPAGSIDISGNLQLNTTGTFNANGGTIILNGGGAQTVSGANKTFRNITVNKSGGGVTLSTAMNLTGLLDLQSATAVASSGNLTLISNGSGTASIGDLSGGGSVTGNVIVQRFITGVGRHFRDISPQVLSPTVAQIISSGITITGPFTGSSFPCGGCVTNNSSMFFYDETVGGVQTLGYVAHPPSGGNSTTSTLTQGRGYTVLVRNELGSPTMSLTSTINSGTIGLPVTFTSSGGGAAEDGWNLIGNPYPSAVDWDIIAGWTKTTYSSNAISVWDPTKGTSGGYRTWNGSSGDLASGRIAAGQGFWIHAVSGTAITINEQAKTNTATSFLRKADTTVDFLEIALRDNESADEDYAYIQVNSKASLNYDDYDGVKLKSPSFNLTSLSKDGVPLSINLINEIPQDDPVFLRITDIGIGNFKLNINGSGLFGDATVILHDKLTGEAIDITKEGYSFMVTESMASQPIDRFYLMFGEKDSAPVSKEILRIYPNPVVRNLGIIVSDPQANREALVLDIMGKPVSTIQLQNESEVLTGSLDMYGLPAGIYMVKISSGGQVHIKKFVKN